MLEKDENRPNSRQPEDSDFQQQRLKAWQPLLTPRWVVGIFFCVGVLFSVIGAIILGTTSSVQEYVVRYDDTAALSTPTGVAVPIDSDMAGPIYVYYRLSNFYQNHRRYVKSRSDLQLQGDPLNTANCDPLEKNATGAVYYPCGLIANSFFNDVFDAWLCHGVGDINLDCTGTLTNLGNGSDPLNVNNPLWQKAGIAWSSDVNAKFKAVDTTSIVNSITTLGANGYQLPAIVDEDFIVWMRTSGLPTFKKLYRVIHQDLPKGSTLIIKTNNVFNVGSFNGQKAIVVGNTSWLGGKNSFLGWAYIVVGIISVIVALLFFIKNVLRPRPLGDLNYFKWQLGH